MRPILSRLASVQRWVSDREFSPQTPAGFTRFAKMLTEAHELGASRWTSVFSPASADRLISSSATRSDTGYLPEMENSARHLMQSSDGLRGSLAVDLQYWLPSDLLVKVDRMTMAHGVEARAPFLDPDLVRAVIAMPADQKMNLRQGKLFLRRALEKKFPGELGRKLVQRKKHGFEVPVRDWLLATLRDQVEDRLSARKLADSGVFDSAQVSRLWTSFLAAPPHSPLRRKVWLIFCFQSWHELHRAKFGFSNGAG